MLLLQLSVISAKILRESRELAKAGTPILVALMSAGLGYERVTAWQWAGAALSAAGIYVVVGGAAAVSLASIAGDLMMLAAVLCWSASTVGARPLVARLSPLVVTGYSMAIGCVFYVPFAWPAIRHVAWRSVSARAWAAVMVSAVFALCVAYMIWYTALERIGNTRTAIYSNLVPIAAMLVASLWLGERIGAVKLAGAAAILAGVALTKVQDGERAVPEPA